MNDLTLFVLAVIAVLATPGPTNTLLLTGASASGWRALALLPAELAGYLIAVLLWRLAIAPMTGQDAVMTLVRLGAGLYLLLVAGRIWRRDGSAAVKAQLVRVHEVGIATLLNPKALIFALAIFPPPPTDIGVHLALFAILVPLLGGCWIGLGLAIGRAVRPGRGGLIVQRIGAAVTGLFATVLVATTIA